MSPNYLYHYLCSVCLEKTTDPRPDANLCAGCEGLEIVVAAKRAEAAAKRELADLRRQVLELKRTIGEIDTADILPDAPEGSCAA